MTRDVKKVYIRMEASLSEIVRHESPEHPSPRVISKSFGIRSLNVKLLDS